MTDVLPPKVEASVPNLVVEKVPAVGEKSPLYSKTLWIAAFTAITAFVPPVNQWIAQNPQLYATLVGGLFAGLRLVTKGKVSIQ